MQSHASPLRWLMISLAFAATVVTYMERQTLSVVVPVLRDQFHMSSVAYSRVIFTFMLAYTIMNGISGPLIDRFGTRLGYALTTAWWAGSAMLQALAQGPISLGFYRFLLGMGEAGNWPGAVKVVAEWFAPEERALASGIFNSGAAFGAIITPPIAVAVVLRAGWRWAFFGVGLVALLWVIVWSIIYRTPPEAKQEAAAPVIAPWVLFRQRFVWSFTVSKVFLDPVWYFYVFWFPQYLKVERHLDLKAIGKYAWIPYLVAGLGSLAGGWLAGFLLKRGIGTTQARKSAFSLFVVLMMASIPAVLVSDFRVSIALVAVGMLGYTGVTANMLAFPADVYPKNMVASIWGLASMGAGFGGMLFVLITGWVVDHYSFVPVFIGFGLVPLIALAIVWWVLGPLRPATTT